MNMHTGLGRLSVSGFAVLAAIVYAWVGVRESRCDAVSGRSRFAVVFVALLSAALILLRVASPIAGYALVCLASASSQMFDLLRNERARRRKVASLAPRPAAEAVPTVWVAIAMVSVLMLAPYVIVGEERADALLVGTAALVMAGIAWRIASAPIQLYGDDIPYERMRDRASRSRRAGLSAVVAIGCVFAFISFANSGLQTVLPLQRNLLVVSFLTWAALGGWVLLYSHHLDRQSVSAS